MLTSRVMGLFAILPISILLTISFFVLLSMRKADTKGLKVFGYVVAGILWAAALLVFSTGVYSVATGRGSACPVLGMMSGKMHKMGKYEKMPRMMDKDAKMPRMMDKDAQMPMMK